MKPKMEIHHYGEMPKPKFKKVRSFKIEYGAAWGKDVIIELNPIDILVSSYKGFKPGDTISYSNCLGGRVYGKLLGFIKINEKVGYHPIAFWTISFNPDFTVIDALGRISIDLDKYGIEWYTPNFLENFIGEQSVNFALFKGGYMPIDKIRLEEREEVNMGEDRITEALHPVIVDSFPNTKDAVLVQKWFGAEFDCSRLGRLIGIFLAGKEDDVLNEAKRLEKEEEERKKD